MIKNIFIDIIREMYGKRAVSFYKTDEHGEKILSTEEFDFDGIDYDGLDIKVNIGAATYWSQLMQVQTMDAFFKNGIIDDAVLYLEHLPEGYVSGKEEIIREIKARKKALSTQNQPVM